MAMIDIVRFRERQEQKLITGRVHPTEDLIIWNYTLQCTYQQAWDDVTIQSRGLITKHDGTIVSRPFKKFWNLEENKVDLPLEPFKVTAKEDGSLGIAYLIGDMPYIATRGSFISEQAIKANYILHQKYKDFPFKKDYTYLYEIIYPQNRIVVDYGNKEDLILLAAIHTETGEEINIHTEEWQKLCPFPIVKHYDGIADIHELKRLEEKNRQGFVICFQRGLRVKVKFQDYVRIHRIIFGTNARSIWEYLKEGKPLAGLLDRVPDEFIAWVKSISRDLSEQYRAIHGKTQMVYKEITQQANIPTPIKIGETITVKEVETLSRAMKKHIQEQFAQYPDIEHFLLLLYSETGKNKKQRLHDEIWDSLYPEALRPFRIEEETQG
jgi:RNA ligase